MEICEPRVPNSQAALLRPHEIDFSHENWVMNSRRMRLSWSVYEVIRDSHVR